MKSGSPTRSTTGRKRSGGESSSGVGMGVSKTLGVSSSSPFQHHFNDGGPTNNNNNSPGGLNSGKDGIPFTLKGPISVQLPESTGDRMARTGCSVLDLTFQHPTQIGELVFMNYYTAWISIYIKRAAVSKAVTKSNLLGREEREISPSGIHYRGSNPSLSSVTGTGSGSGLRPVLQRSFSIDIDVSSPSEDKLQWSSPLARLAESSKERDEGYDSSLQSAAITSIFNGGIEKLDFDGLVSLSPTQAQTRSRLASPADGPNGQSSKHIEMDEKLMMGLEQMSLSSSHSSSTTATLTGVRKRRKSSGSGSGCGSLNSDMVENSSNIGNPHISSSSNTTTNTLTNPNSTSVRPWELCIEMKRLMPWPHFENGSQDLISIPATESVVDWSNVQGIRLVLHQPSTVWKRFSVEQISVFKLLPKRGSSHFDDVYRQKDNWFQVLKVNTKAVLVAGQMIEPENNNTDDEG